MPRQPRCIEAGRPYHLISRFVDREWFINATNEREYYLSLLGRALRNTDWRLISYAIMSNHIHLESIAGEQPLGDWIRAVHSPFADAMNRARNRIGCMFVRGPKAHPVDPGSFGHLLAYIHNNPVRAGVCAAAGDTNWTSHRAYIGRVSAPSWLHVKEGLARAGFEDPRAFDTWVNDPARVAMELMFTEEHYEQEAVTLRAATASQRRAQHCELADKIVGVAASVAGVSLAKLRSSSRQASSVLARAVAVRCAARVNVSGEAIARALQLSPARVSTLRTQELSKEVSVLSEQVVRLVGTSVSEGV